MRSRRAVLTAVHRERSTHAGLWLDKYLGAQTVEGDETGAGEKAKLIREVSSLPVPEGYPRAFERRREAFVADPRVVLAPATAIGRLIVGLGAKGALEAGIHLEHTWGVPLLPGSALKGLAAAAARKLVVDDGWRPGSARAATSYDELFGSTNDSGAVVFHDAWWDPTGCDTVPIALDVMTVHHADYYQGRAAPPSDMDSPNPVAFASATGRYLLAVEGAAEWAEAALHLLKLGLAELGIGAKTNAAYGRMDVDWLPREEREAQAKAEAARRAEEARARAEATGPPAACNVCSAES